MAESCTGVTYAQLDRHQASYIRDETYSAALAELVNTQHGHPSPHSGATGPPLLLTGSVSGPAAKPNLPGM
jgi:hypothetical protein